MSQLIYDFTKRCAKCVYGLEFKMLNHIVCTHREMSWRKITSSEDRVGAVYVCLTLDSLFIVCKSFSFCIRRMDDEQASTAPIPVFLSLRQFSNFTFLCATRQQCGKHLNRNRNFVENYIKQNFREMSIVCRRSLVVSKNGW